MDNYLKGLGQLNNLTKQIGTRIEIKEKKVKKPDSKSNSTQPPSKTKNKKQMKRQSKFNVNLMMENYSKNGDELPTIENEEEED